MEKVLTFIVAYNKSVKSVHVKIFMRGGGNHPFSNIGKVFKNSMKCIAQIGGSFYFHGGIPSPEPPYLDYYLI